MTPHGASFRFYDLGSAAGGGFPQWNCGCDVCRLAWAGDPRVKPRTQASIAVTAEAHFEGRAVESATRFVLINASPDLRQQIIATPALQPRGLRMSPIAAVVLTGGEVDQTAGLLTLRERGPFGLYGTPARWRRSPPIRSSTCSPPMWCRARPISPGAPFALPGGIEAELFLVPGKAPLYLEGDNPALEAETEANVGIELRAAGARLVFIPGAAKLTPAIAARLADADVVLFDGTLFCRRRDDRGRRRDEDRASHGAYAGRRSRRHLGGACRARAAAHPDPHQQYQPDPDRRFAAAPRRRKRRVSKSPRTE